ncbi:MAG: endonuclease/exonuclease/phosphatase family protein [Planctomycetota bacterium]
MSERTSRWRIGAVGLVQVVGTGAAGATLLAYVPHAWPFELLVHWRVQYVAVLVPAVLVLLAARRFGWSAGLAVFAVLDGIAVAPLFMGEPDRAPDGTPVVRALLANVNSGNLRADLVGAAIRATDPDVVVLEEVSARWLRDLAPVLAAYPFSETAPRNDNFGIALFSRIEMRRALTTEFGSAGLPTIVASLGPQDASFTLVATHPLPPMGGRMRYLRDEQLRALAEEIPAERGPVVLLGDLNTSPFAPIFREFLATSGLRDSSVGRGHQATWPARFGPFGIALDHCLVSDDVVVTRREVGPFVGSDHLPITVEFAIRARRP